MSNDVAWRIDARYLSTGRRSGISFVYRACQAAGVMFIPVLHGNPTPDELGGAAAAATHITTASSCVSRHRWVRAQRPSSVMPRRSCGPPASASARPTSCSIAGTWPTHSRPIGLGALAIPLTHAVDQGWRSVTVLAGAFPESLTCVPFGSRMLLPRFDAEMFMQLPVAVDYGDFGVEHRSPPGDTRTEPEPAVEHRRRVAVYKENSATSARTRCRHSSRSAGTSATTVCCVARSRPASARSPTASGLEAKPATRRTGTNGPPPTTWPPSADGSRKRRRITRNGGARRPRRFRLVGLHDTGFADGTSFGVLCSGGWRVFTRRSSGPA